jgi:hypothetical protein
MCERGPAPAPAPHLQLLESTQLSVPMLFTATKYVEKGCRPLNVRVLAVEVCDSHHHGMGREQAQTAAITSLWTIRKRCTAESTVITAP